ncbi:uncharacterized protein LOC107013362 [Solanum pennellii]|uniref:Uncharacterized protein LOC107013362 n=1 Tax=Solanum pennellii TaxID=28526 RepID=A0ABM1GBP8_SOLPN|nr:uncharacterized protein LOC107013362 [Solanum pennellii]
MEIIKWLDVGIIYLIKDSSWVCPILCVPKKGGVNVVPNAKNELVLMRKVTGWRVFLDYHNLNACTQKDQFPIPVIDEMIDRRDDKEGYHLGCVILQKPSTLHDVDISNMVEDTIKVLMDDLFVVVYSFDGCLMHLDEVTEKLPPPISIRGVRCFLGHEGLYRRFIKDFSKIAHPLCKLI